MNTLVAKLTSIEACREAVEFAERFDNEQTAWDSCPRGDWMLWLLGRINKSTPWSDGRKPLLGCTLECAETVKHLWPEKQKDKIEEAIATLRRWIAGTATKEEAQAARRSLCDADAADAAYAADAAAYAADAADADTADAAADAADAATYAAYAAAYAAYAAAAADAANAANAAADAAYAAYTAARIKNRKQCAAIILKHF